MSILMTTDVSGFFGEAVDTALATRRVEATSGAKEYLVGVLVDFAHVEEQRKLDKPVAFLLNEALAAPPAEKLEKLKDVGDGSLYVSGFFHEHLAARGVDKAYIARLGSTAYGAAADLLGKGDPGGIHLFAEMATKFERFAEVLREVADAIFAGSAKDSTALLKVYERWLKTGSNRLGQELAARGMMPMRPAGGMQ
jgi:hypothetical protein